MIIARAYLIMGRPVVEYSCVHDDDPMQSHLLQRQELPTEELGFFALLDALQLSAAWLNHAVERGEVDYYDEC